MGKGTIIILITWVKGVQVLPDFQKESEKEKQVTFY